MGRLNSSDMETKIRHIPSSDLGIESSSSSSYKQSIFNTPAPTKNSTQLIFDPQVNWNLE